MTSKLSRRTFLTTAATVAPATWLWGQSSPSAISEMVAASTAFLKTLDDKQRKKTVFSFDSEERENWHYIPKSRSGIALKELTDEQREAAFRLLDSGLSKSGSLKSRRILELEGILAVIENNPRMRDVGAYYFTVFGTPGDTKGWGWRFEGHHISINITQIGNHLSATPAFWGANPAHVHEGNLKGVRTLANEEDMARKLAQSLHAAGKPVITEAEAPREYHTRAARRVSALPEKGVSYDEMTSDQQMQLTALLKEYTSNFNTLIAEQELNRIRMSGMEKIRFSWAGGIKKGDRHYYRLQGPTFLLEYVNYQNDANHIHTAWRSFDGDYGLDALALN